MTRLNLARPHLDLLNRQGLGIKVPPRSGNLCIGWHKVAKAVHRVRIAVAGEKEDQPILGRMTMFGHEGAENAAEFLMVGVGDAPDAEAVPAQRLSHLVHFSARRVEAVPALLRWTEIVRNALHEPE